MSQVFIEGFDLWGAIPTTGSTFVGTSSSSESLSLSATVPFADTYSQSLCVQQSTGGTGYNNDVSCVVAALSGAKTQNIAGFWFRYAGALPTSSASSGCSLLLQWGQPSSPCLCLGIDSSGVLHIINTYASPSTFASGTTQLKPNCWYFIEFQANLNSSIGANTCFVKLNGTVEANVATSTNTTDPNAYYTAFDYVSVGFLTVGAVPVSPGVYAPTAVYIDDCYVFDLTGGSDNTPFGSEHVHSTPPSTTTLNSEGYLFYPSASSSATFTGTPASTATRVSSITDIATFTGISPTSPSGLVFVEGFDAYGAYPGSVGGFNPGNGFEVIGTWTPSFVTSVVRGGNGASMWLAIGSSSLTYGQLTYSFTATGEIIAGFGFQYAYAALYTGGLPSGGYHGGNTPLLDLINGTNSHSQMALCINSSGVLALVQQLSGTVLESGTTTLEPGRWYYIEFHLTLSTSVAVGACTVMLNGVTEITIPSGTNTEYDSSTVSKLNFGFPTGGTSNGFGVANVNVYFDDFYLGLANYGFLGGIHITTLFPSSDSGTVQWATASGLSHYAMVDGNPFSGTDYESITASTTGVGDYFGLSAISGSPNIIAVVLHLVAGNPSGSSPPTVFFAIANGATKYELGNTGLAVGPSLTSALHLQVSSPATNAAWTTSELSSYGFGYTT